MCSIEVIHHEKCVHPAPGCTSTMRGYRFDVRLQGADETVFLDVAAAESREQEATPDVWIDRVLARHEEVVR